MTTRIFSIMVISLVVVFAAVPSIVHAYDPFQAACSDPHSETYSSALCQGQRGDTSQNPLTGKQGLLRGIANIIALVAGLAAVITIIVGGMRYITSGGDPAKAKSAKDAIVAALVGVLIIALADAIISLVLSRI